MLRQVIIMIFAIWLMRCMGQDGCVPRLSDYYVGRNVWMIGALLDFSESKCENVNEAAVEEFEAFKWALRRIRNSGYLNSIGVTLDALGYDTCGEPDLATKSLRKLLNSNHQSYVDVKCSNDSHLLLGVFGPSLSGPAKAVATILSKIHPANRLLQISHSVTATYLTKDKQYSNFVSLAPTNHEQALAIIDVILQQKWNYIALVTTNDTYGNDGETNLVSLAKIHNVCIGVRQKVNGTVFAHNILSVIEAITIGAAMRPTVVVFFGKRDFAKIFLNYASKRQAETNKLEFIFSDAMELDVEFFTSVKEVSLGAIVIKPASYQIQEFTQYWNELLLNATQIEEESRNNPGIEKLFRKLHNCTDGGASLDKCDTSNFAPRTTGAYSDHAIIAAYSFSFLAKHSCLTGACDRDVLSKTSRKYFIDKIINDGIYMDSIQDRPAGIDGLYTVGNHRILRKENDKHVFDYFSFQICRGGTGFCFVDVGIQNKDKWTIDVNQLKIYDINGNVITDESIGLCPAGFVCNNCLQTPEEKRWLYVPGDIVVLASVPIHTWGPQPYTVGDLREQSSIQLAEAVLFARNVVQERNGIFGQVFNGKTIGTLIFDSAYSPSVAQKAIYNVFFGGDVNLPDWKEIAPKVIGVLGGLGSSVSKDIANVMTKLKIPQISYGSTSETLSDRTSYPYFARICAPDTKQVQLMINIIRLMEWEYISVVYIDNSYGQTGMRLLRESAADNNICIAQTIPVINSVNTVLSDLRKTAYAKVVVLFVISSMAKTLLQAFADNRNPIKVGEFVFIGTESWGNRAAVIQGNNVAEGSITVLQDLPLIPKFDEEISKKTPDNIRGTEQKWLLSYWQDTQRCSWPVSYDKTFKVQCNKSIPLTSLPQYHQDPWVPFVVYAFYSMVIGVDKAWKTLCGSKMTCPDLRSHPQIVYNELKKTRFDIRGTRSPVEIYDNNGDGRGGYKVLNIQRADSGDGLKYEEVGYWSETYDNLKEMKMKLKFPLVSPGKLIKSRIPNNHVREICFKTKPHDGVTGNRTSCAPVNVVENPAFLGVVISFGILSAIALTLAIIIILQWRSRRKDQHGDKHIYLSTVEVSDAAQPAFPLGSNNNSYYNSDVSISFSEQNTIPKYAL